MAIFDACRTSGGDTVKVDAKLPSTAPSSGVPAGTFASFVKASIPMPKHVLILNCGDEFLMAQGKLNAHLADQHFAWFTSRGAVVKLVNIAAKNDIPASEHIANVQWADLIVFQFPMFWSNVSNSLKNFFDSVYTAGYGTLVTGDGRTRSDPSKKYGSGGCCKGKYYMLSMTCNTPKEAFDDPAQFYRGQGVEYGMFHVHSPSLFLGMTPVTSFVVHDLAKAGFDIKAEEAALAKHLKKTFVVA